MTHVDMAGEELYNVWHDESHAKNFWSQISIQAALCSKCGRAVNVKQAKEFRFCPYCGTRMDGVDTAEGAR